MSSKRPPSTPPDLPGFDYVSILGSGGFADVFLYSQHVPKREVAVKVLLKDKLSSTAAAASFSAEADLMAQLSGHPAIVSIYEAGVSQDGRPYLVMENCPRPNLQVRFRKEALGVAESLRIGVQVAGAVETAHRAGILHRDIKPANILVTAYNRPALTDFGIAGAAGGGDDAVGMSIPWSPPESFLDPPQSAVTSDVYALGATVYTLLAGHSPFEVPGERNTGAIMIERIQSTPVPALRRSDMPASLNAVLVRAMAKSVSTRYPTALDFARALQRIQAELSMSVTPVDVLDDALVDDQEEDEDDGRTRVRSIVSINPEVPVKPASRGRFSLPPSAPTDHTASTVPRATSTWGKTTADPPDEDGDHTVLRPPAAAFKTPVTAPEPVVDDTILKQPEPQVAEASQDTAPLARRGGRGLAIGASAAVIAVIAVGAWWGMARGTDGTPVQTTAEPMPVDVVQQDAVAAPDNVVGSLDGSIATFTWGPEALPEGVDFQWRVVGADAPYAAAAEPRVEYDITEQGGACIEVRTRAASGRVSDVVEGCAT